MPFPRRPDVLRGRVFRKRDVVARGLVTEAQLRSSAWRRLFQGVYADASLPETVALRGSGARLMMPPEAAFSGRTAAFLHGAEELARKDEPLEVSVPAGVRFGPVAGVRVRRVALAGSDVVLIGTRPCTTPVRTAWDIPRHESLIDAVPALDVLLAKAVVGGVNSPTPPLRAGRAEGLRGRGRRSSWPTRWRSHNPRAGSA